jgi:hypothetical protein
MRTGLVILMLLRSNERPLKKKGKNGKKYRENDVGAS